MSETENPAETLREAATLMRARAEAATSGPWAHYGHSIIRPAEIKDGIAPSYSAAYHREDAEHIASWHPGVALAVADWLDGQLEAFLSTRPGNHLSTQAALNVARTYLGRP